MPPLIHAGCWAQRKQPQCIRAFAQEAAGCINSTVIRAMKGKWLSQQSSHRPRMTTIWENDHQHVYYRWCTHGVFQHLWHLGLPSFSRKMRSSKCSRCIHTLINSYSLTIVINHCVDWQSWQFCRTTIVGNLCVESLKFAGEVWVLASATIRYVCEIKSCLLVLACTVWVYSHTHLKFS